MIRSSPPGFLTGDLRLRVFGVLFGLGTILHELEFALEQGLVGPLGEYMERWSRVYPSVGWGSETGLALHAATAILGLLLIVLPWSRLLLVVLTPVFLLSQLASPGRISSHTGLMAAGLVVVFLLGLAEWIDRLVHRDRVGSPGTDWSAWTLTGLASVCALTYFFAFVYKLNPVWFSGASAAPAFLIHPVAPLLDRLGLPPVSRTVLAVVAIYGTLVVELLLPLLLAIRRSRRLGCLLGLVFHLPMLAQGVSDFPVLILAFYPTFLDLAETREVLERLRARPTPRLILGSAILGAAGVWAVWRAPKVRSFYRGAAELHRVIPDLYTALTAAAIVLFIYAILVLGRWFLARQPGGTPSAKERVAEGGRRPATLVRPASVGSVVAGTLILLVGAAVGYTNLAPFAGLPTVGAMFMYSGISRDRSNHLVIPHAPGLDLYTIVTIEALEAPPSDASAVREFRVFLDWLSGRGRPPAIQLNLLRYHVDRMCRTMTGQTIGLRLKTRVTGRLDFADVCAVPTMRRYVPLPVGVGCVTSCGPLLRLWARGALAPRLMGQAEESSPATASQTAPDAGM